MVDVAIVNDDSGLKAPTSQWFMGDIPVVDRVIVS